MKVICRKTIYTIQLRHVHTGHDFKMSNAFIQSENLHGLQAEAERQLSYVAQKFDDNLPLSQIIIRAHAELGYLIHPASFMAILKTIYLSTLENFGELAASRILNKLYSLDDLLMLPNPDPFDETGSQYFWEKYLAITDFYIECYQQKEATLHGTPVNTNLPTTNTNILTDNISDTASTSSSSTSSSLGEEHIDWFTWVITGVTFIFVKGIAWLFNRNKVPPLDEDEDTANSPLEDGINYTFLIIFICMIFIPTTFFMLYSFRYYYYYHINMKLSNLYNIITRFFHKYKHLLPYFINFIFCEILYSYFS